jgi:hypothetical protein
MPHIFNQSQETKGYLGIDLTNKDFYGTREARTNLFQTYENNLPEFIILFSPGLKDSLGY